MWYHFGYRLSDFPLALVDPVARQQTLQFLPQVSAQLRPGKSLRSCEDDARWPGVRNCGKNTTSNAKQLSYGSKYDVIAYNIKVEYKDRNATDEEGKRLTN